MLQLCFVILCLSLFIIIWQDFKQRAIHFSLPILVFLLSLVINYLKEYLDFLDIVKNIGFVAVNILGLVLYFSFKNRKLINPIDSMIGLGDILFFVAITPLFILKDYILFFILGMGFSLILHLIINSFKKQINVPLAGYLALFLVGVVFFENILNLNLTHLNF
jgi:hypothetical protein